MRPALLAGACLCVATAGAQELPDPTRELQRQDRQRQTLREHHEAQPWVAGGQPTPPSPERLPADERPCVTIARVELVGELRLDSLYRALNGPLGDDPPAGRCLGSEGITVLIRRLQQALIEGGYLTSHARAPEQDLRTGVLTLRVDAGRVGAVRGPEPDRPPPAGALALRAGDVLNLRDLEQTTENMRRLPSLAPGIRIEPGEHPGESDIIVDPQPGRAVRLSLALDDAGHRPTGKVQGNATLGWDDPLGIADLVYFSAGRDLGGRDPGPRGNGSRMLHYSVPWGYWLFGLTLSRNRYHQTLYGPYTSYLYHGRSSQHEVSAGRVLRRDGVSRTRVGIKGFLRASRNHIDDLEVLVQRRRTAGWEVDLEHRQHFAPGTLDTQLAWRHGTGAFGALPAPEEYAGHGTARMKRLYGQTHWRMPLEAHGFVYGYDASLQLQWSRTRLTPQDRFCLGGRASVRGTDGAQALCGDHGVLLRQTLEMPPAGDFAVRPYAALDIGAVTTTSKADVRSLGGVAVGLRGRLPLPARHGAQFDIFIGRPLVRPRGFGATDPTAGFNLRADF